MTTPYLLTINGGSASLKYALFPASEPLRRIRSGEISRIGPSQPDSSYASHQEAGRAVLDALNAEFGPGSIAAVGHRLVHGGSRFHEPVCITPDILDQLRRLSPLAPDHLPAQIALVEIFDQLQPKPPQIACFDTAFHHNLPRVAQIMPIPRRFETLGVRRYGFHGLSFTYLRDELIRLAGPDAVLGRVILAHLGSGASLAALRGGQSVDTTMAFTPAAGLVMGTRSGDLDPGLVAYLARQENLTPDRFDHLVNKESGLLGVSETSSDIRDLLAREAQDIRAAEALDLFCYRVKQALGAFAATLGGLDTLVFSGGIGEHAAPIRKRITDGLEFLGIVLDPDRNQANQPVISTESSPVTVRIIPTDEELVIARSLAALLSRHV